MSGGLGNKLTGQIGEYLVCAELGKLGFIATPFAGNVPAFDVLATDKYCRTVPIQVKASRSDVWPSYAKNWMQIVFDDQTSTQNYLGPLQIENPKLIYVCVAIASIGGRDRFFILTKADLQDICIASYRSFMEPHKWKRPRNPVSFDNRYNIEALQKFEDNWTLISDQLQPPNPDELLSSDSEGEVV